MKSFFFPLLVYGVFVGVSTNSAGALPKIPPDDKWTFEKITPFPTATTLDNALFALSETASINVLVDAMELPGNNTICPFAQSFADKPDVLNRSDRGDVIANVAWQGGLTYERSTPNTYVFWHQPDRDKLQDLVIAWQKQLDHRYPYAQAKHGPRAWSDFLAQQPAWNLEPATPQERAQNAQGLATTWSWQQLPPDLRDITKAEFFRQVCATDSGPDFRQFEAQWWHRARLRLRPSQRPIYDEQGKATRTDHFLSLYLDSQVAGVPMFNIGKQSKYKVPDLESQGYSTNGQISAYDHAIAIVSKSTQPFSKAAMDAAESPAPAPAPAPGVNLSTEAALQKTVQFSAHRTPVREFLGSVALQCGVSLALDDTTPRIEKARLIARSAGMTAFEALNAVARLYDGYWVKQGTTYSLRLHQRDELHAMMAQLGYQAFYQSSKRSFKQRESDGDQLAEAVVGAADFNAMKSPEGALFFELSSELQNRVLQLWRGDHLGLLLVNQQRLDDVMAQDVRLRFGPLNKENREKRGFFGFYTGGNQELGALGRGEAALGAYSTDGKLIAPLFPNFSASQVNVAKRADTFWLAYAAAAHEREIKTSNSLLSAGVLLAFLFTVSTCTLAWYFTQNKKRAGD